MYAVCNMKMDRIEYENNINKLVQNSAEIEFAHTENFTTSNYYYEKSFETMFH